MKLHLKQHALDMEGEYLISAIYGYSFGDEIYNDYIKISVVGSKMIESCRLDADLNLVDEPIFYGEKNEKHERYLKALGALIDSLSVGQPKESYEKEIQM